MVMADPPYNVAVGNANTKQLFKVSLHAYLEFSPKWIENAMGVMVSTHICMFGQAQTTKMTSSPCLI